VPSTIADYCVATAATTSSPLPAEAIGMKEGEDAAM
jgi:hypothetical protein